MSELTQPCNRRRAADPESRRDYRNLRPNVILWLLLWVWL
jgi:hypothetical protein